MKNLEALENLLLETLGAETMLLNVIKALDIDTKAVYHHERGMNNEIFQGLQNR